MAKMKYTKDLPRRLYGFFCSYDGTGALPSFDKFARSIGTTLSELMKFRTHAKFDAAYRECCEIRRDYLIDGALAKRLDGSFTKYLLECEYGTDDRGADAYSITLRVLE